MAQLVTIHHQTTGREIETAEAHARALKKLDEIKGPGYKGWKDGAAPKSKSAAKAADQGET